jgi:hypothetical protein
MGNIVRVTIAGSVILAYRSNPPRSRSRSHSSGTHPRRKPVAGREHFSHKSPTRAQRAPWAERLHTCKAMSALRYRHGAYGVVMMRAGIWRACDGHIQRGTSSMRDTIVIKAICRMSLRCCDSHQLPAADLDTTRKRLPLRDTRHAEWPSSMMTSHSASRAKTHAYVAGALFSSSRLPQRAAARLFEVVVKRYEYGPDANLLSSRVLSSRVPLLHLRAVMRSNITPHTRHSNAEHRSSRYLEIKVLLPTVMRYPVANVNSAI